MRKVLIATNNQGKFKEIKKILEGLPIEFINLKDAGIDFKVEETVKTFKANAILKARTYGKMTGLLTLAEDSGLEVDVLGGMPGVCSARYCDGNDKDRYQLLLKNLTGIPTKKRTARFRATIAIFNPKTNKIRTFQEKLEGRITFKPKGKHGFGYDPIFYVPQLRKRTAQLTTEEKNKISHRGKAWRRIRRILEKLYV